MILLPAIDLYDGKAVRLYKGDYEQMTVYSDSPVSVASDFRSLGAAWAHIVDLEGARDGTTPNLKTVERIISENGLNVEVGGGIRREDTVRRYLDAGACRVILGTAALLDRPFLERMISQYGEKIAVGVDSRDGIAATHGWRETSGVKSAEFCAELQKMDVHTVICTDISRDGAMKGPNRELYRELKESLDMDIIASGGVSSLEDVRALRELGVYGAIIGKAYYTGDIRLGEALEAAK